MELPWPTITAASGGWILVGYAILSLLSGKHIVSRREFDAMEARAIRAETGWDEERNTNRRLVEVNAKAIATGDLTTSVVQAARAVTIDEGVP